MSAVAMTGEQSPGLLTATQAALYLGISTRAFYSLVQAGNLSSYRFGPRLTRFSVADLDAFKGRCRSVPIRSSTPTVTSVLRLSDVAAHKSLAASFLRLGVRLKI